MSLHPRLLKSKHSNPWRAGSDCLGSSLSLYLCCRLVLVSKRTRTKSAYACDFLLHEGTLHLILADDGPALRLLNYSKQAEESKRGTVLVPRAAFHVGAPITRLQRLAASRKAAHQRHAVLWGAVDGSIGCVAPISETSFLRLGFLATKMVVGLRHDGGLHPRAFRAQNAGAASTQELKNLLDGALLARFNELGFEEQQKLAMQIGSTPTKVMEALAEIADVLPD